LDAAKVDILEHLQKEIPGVYEFRRIAEIANVMIPLINSFGNHHEHGALAGAMRDSEIIAPHLFEVLAGRAFDGNATLREKYATMLEQQTQLRRTMLDVQDAAQQVALQRHELDAHEVALKAHEGVLERERERLQLEARTRGKEITLPALPRLTNPDDEGGDED
jgi:hypothetical protein